MKNIRLSKSIVGKAEKEALGRVIDDAYLGMGKFVKEYKRRTYKLKVVKVEGGIGYELNGTVYSSPSTAAKSLTKGEVNGWRFWELD